MNTTNTKSVNIKRYAFFLVSVGLIFIVFILRLIDWQVFNSEYYRVRANSSNIYFVKTDPVRGEIVDCDGTGLAVNDTGYKLVIDRLLVESGNETKLILKSINILESFGDTWIDILPIYLKGEEFLFSEGKDSQISTLKESLNLPETASAEECILSMSSKYKIEDDLDKKDKRIICSVKYNMDKSGVYYSKSTPYVLADNLSKEAVVVIMEKSEDLKGIRVQASLVRRYINGEVAPHIVGYTGFMSSEEYEKRKDTYPMDAIIGKTGIESAYEDYLKGTGGKRMIQMSAQGETIDVCEKEPSTAGNTVFLTISSKLQEVANKSLQENVLRAKKSGASDCESGAVVVLNVNDFSVLAAATYPGYDLTKFMQDKSYYAQLYKDKTIPLLNRAFSGAYAPGSIYKPLVACAALQEGKIKPDEPIFCGGSFNYYTGYKLRCMGHHGSARLVNALAKSCNVYFAELGRRLGADTIANWARKFGIGIKTGIEIGESQGILAGPQHCEAVGAKWYPSGSSQAAIGQSDNMFTPVQLATYAATIANGGTRYKTHLVSKIMDYNRSKIIKEFGAELAETTGVSPENLEVVKKGMREVVLSGTARDFSSYPIAIAAKTGTAQNSGSDHTTFICFAPYDKPEIAISVVIAHGKLGAVSKNVARDIMDVYFNLKNN